MKVALGNACILLGLFQSAIAQDQTPLSPRIEFECGGAQVVIDSGPKGFNGKHRIVYRAICGGSGCHDSNWGIIDPATLQEILKPIGENTERATEILGARPPPVPRWHSLLVP